MAAGALGLERSARISAYQCAVNQNRPMRCAEDHALVALWASFSATSAFSSQYVIPISRYIVVAMVALGSKALTVENDVISSERSELTGSAFGEELARAQR